MALIVQQQVCAAELCVSEDKVIKLLIPFVAVETNNVIISLCIHI